MKSETIYLKNRAIVDIYYRDDIEKELEPFKGLDKEYQKLIDFFNVSPPRIKVQFLYSRNEMDKKWGSKTESWLQAMVDNSDPCLIYIFSPTCFEQMTGCKKEEMLRTLVHEIAHTFVSEINNKCFYWINEGVCQFMEGEYSSSKEIAKENWLWFKNKNVLIDSDIPWDEQTNYQGYLISYVLVKYIVEVYGKDAVISLLKIKRAPDKNLKDKLGKLLNGDFDKFIDDFEKTLNLI